MLNIIIDGKRAALKENLSFEFVAENRRFSKSDSYTLEISLPLKDCKQNLDIFGMIYRKDMSPKSLILECEIIDKAFHKKGSVIITEFTDSDVKCQFLEGRSGSSITSPVADLYINELDIASPSTAKDGVSPAEAWASSRDCVALPWVNNESGNIQNMIVYDNGTYKWSDDIYGLSWMPYLTTVIKSVCAAIGYDCDISSIESDEKLRYLLVCNALPYPWYIPEVAKALPHWTVEEFFSKLEDFLFGEFEIDHVSKSIKYISPEDLSQASKIVDIKTDINDFSAEVYIQDSECSAIDIANVSYKKSDHRKQKFYDCNQAVKKLRQSDMVIEFESLDELIQQINDKFWIKEDGHRNMNLHKLYYIKEDKKYFCAGCFWQDPETKKNYMGLRNVNDFGARIINNSKDAKSVELEFVPAWIDFTDGTYGFTLFNSPGSFSENSSGAESSSESGNHRGSSVQDVISEDEFDVEKSEYYDRIYIGWWNGSIQFPGTNPFPNVSDVLAVQINNVKRFPFSLSIDSDESTLNLYSKDIDISIRYNISFLTDSLPSPRSIFLIKGKKYVCEKLTATFTVKGMSSKVKGVFWRLND